VQVLKLTSTDGFYVLDLPDAPRSVGVVRLAPKVLVDGAELLARANTYAFAAFGVRAGGASAAINAPADGRDAALAAFIDEVGPLVAEGRLHLSPGTGVSAEDLSPLAGASFDTDVAARGAVAAASAFASGAAAVAGPAAAAWHDRLEAGWSATGGSWAGTGAIDTTVDVLFLAGRPGIVDDTVAASVGARVLTPVTPVPMTAKAYAAVTRAGVTYVPDAVSCAAPLLAAADPDGGDPVERVTRLAAALAAENGAEPWRAAVAKAEQFLATWQGDLPFGRPLA
jgi:hypothetical protein